jgi:hypothetical protein
VRHLVDDEGGLFVRESTPDPRNASEMILGSNKMAGTFRNDFDPLTCSPSSIGSNSNSIFEMQRHTSREIPRVGGVLGPRGATDPDIGSAALVPLTDRSRQACRALERGSILSRNTFSSDLPSMVMNPLVFGR